MLRIALVITELETGGAESCLTELAIFLAARGWQVRVLSLGPPPLAPRDELVLRLATAGVVVHFGQARGAVHFRKTVRWLRSELQQFAPQVVQSMLWHANVICGFVLRGQPMCWVGGMRVSEPRRWRWMIERWSARHMSKMVCVSDDVRRHAELRQGIPSDKLCTIPNGIQTDVPKNALDSSPANHWREVGMPDAHNVLLFVGRLEPQKGALALIEQLPEILSCLPAWQVVFIGEGSQRTSMEKQIQSAGLAERVRLVGWQSQPARWMQASQIVLLPAAYEGMPNVLLEAMSVGKPFVAFAVDGIAQLLADDYPAGRAEIQLSQPGDWPEFQRRVRRLANDALLRGQCGQANRQHVLQHFRLEDQLAKYVDLYGQLVARQGSPATNIS